MRQQTLAEAPFEQYCKTTRREVFFAEMDRVVPWAELCALIEPVYPEGADRPPLERAHRCPPDNSWTRGKENYCPRGRKEEVSRRGEHG